MNTQTYDVAVIGGGIIGAATAYRLGRAGQRVLLIDAGEAGRGTQRFGLREHRH